MQIIIANAFSLSMLVPQHQLTNATYGSRIGETLVKPRIPTPCADPVGYLKAFPDAEIISAVGHADTAILLGDILGIKLEHNRINVKLDSAEKRLLVGQFNGRLPEGTTVLPEGATIEWWLV